MNNLKYFLEKIGFKPKEREADVWHKKYVKSGDYEICVHVNNESEKASTVCFGNLIKIGRKTTSSFESLESYVILECVDRLLEKGYRPERIILEKKWKLGHKGKGFLDIQVSDEEGKSFLMIECKTYGKEYDKAKKDTEKDGGQLFSYFIQERNSQYLCLYSSILESGEIKVFNDIIVVNKEIRNAENSQEAFEAWHPQVWETKGIFQEGDEPYRIEFKGILKRELKPLTEKDGGDIFNKFAEILRKNVVSDKTNAFNKIFNLFLCKIVDEYETSENNALEFQWSEGEKNEDVMLRLNDLYKRGMELYLDLRIEAVSEEELRDVLERAENREDIKQLFIRQKLYSGNEFAFKEVFDKKTFEGNCIVVKEVVKLLEQYQIKYSTKQQFLGDFFENLLNTGIKQESGQFFTPIPIAQFICKSIPIKKIIEKKNNKKEPYFLPYVIDYASGSGHFLTEAMEEIDNHIKNIEESWIQCGEKHRREFLRNQDNFLWAKEYIYGIEKDYRLAKTTKISTFLNGDGDANVICGDGLDHFEKSKDYRKKLTKTNSKNENRQFDILIANPPYSVDGFKTTLEHGKESFKLYPHFTDRSSEIECLFIERAKQLLKDGGIAGIILPVSILSNGKIHLRAREILLKYFEIKAIVEFGSNTFMATKTKTVTLFLRRRGNSEWKMIKSMIDDFFVNFKDITVNGIENAFSRYVEHVFSGLELKDYISLISNKPNEKVKNHELFKEYEMRCRNMKDDGLSKIIKKVEKEKILYFMLVYNQSFVLVKAPRDGSKEKEFLGYEFSTRRGHEGIRILKDEEGNNITKLYSDKPEQIYDENKINSYILKTFEGGEVPSPSKELEDVLQVQKLHNSFDFDRVNFEKRVTTEFSKKKVKIESKWDLVKLEEVCLDILGGGTPSTKKHEYWNGKINWATLVDTKEKYLYSTKRKISEKGLKKSSAILLPVNSVIFSSRATIGDVSIAKVETATNQGYKNFICDPTKIHYEYLYFILKSIAKNIENLASGMTYPEINKAQISNIKIPLPPLHVQEKILQEMEILEKDEKNTREMIEKGENKIDALINHDFKSEKITLDKLCNKITDGSHNPPPALYRGLPMLSSRNIINNSINYDNPRWIDKEGFERENKRTDIQGGDVLMTIVGTIGRVALVPKEFEKFTLQRSVSVLKPKRKIIKSEFLAYCLRTKIIQKNLREMAHGVAQKGVYLREIKSLKISLPLLFEQESIVEKIKKIEVKQIKFTEHLKRLENDKAEVLKKYL